MLPAVEVNLETFVVAVGVAQGLLVVVMAGVFRGLEVVAVGL